MRILTVTNLYPNPCQPQLATFNREQIRALACEHTIRVIAPIAWTVEYAARRAGSPRLPHGRQMEWDGVPVEYPRVVFLPRILRDTYGWFFRRSIRGTFQKAVESLRPDVVYATWAYPDGWAAINLGHRMGLPVVLKVHGSDILQLEQHRGRRRGTIEAVRSADRIIVVSRDLARKVIELGAEPSRVHLIYNGVDEQVFHPGDRNQARQRLGIDLNRPTLLYVGNLFPVKGPDILIEACGLLAARGVEFDLHIVGKGHLRSSLERQAAERGIAHQVRFHGSIAHGDLPDWFRAASMLVLPSRSEGVPNVLLEASACGTPFVASAVGGVPEIAHLGASRLVPPQDPVRLADAIAETLAVLPAASTQSWAGRTHATAARELTAVFEATRGQHSVQADQTLFAEDTRVAVGV